MSSQNNIGAEQHPTQNGAVSDNQEAFYSQNTQEEPITRVSSAPPNLIEQNAGYNKSGYPDQPHGPYVHNNYIINQRGGLRGGYTGASYYSNRVFVPPQEQQSGHQQAQQQQKQSRAIKIINPNTGKDIFTDSPVISVQDAKETNETKEEQTTADTETNKTEATVVSEDAISTGEKPKKEKQPITPLGEAPSSDSEEEASTPMTPMTPSKLTYERDFLLKFQPYCNNAPAMLQNLEIFRSKHDNTNPREKRSYPNVKSPKDWKQGGQLRSPGSADYFKIPRTKSADNVRERGGYNKGYNKGGYQPPQENFTPIAPLQKGENAWGRPQNISEIEQIYRTIKSILNKMTPETFEKLKQKITDIKIESGVVLQGIINIIFEKAIFEPSFSTMYADLCRDICRECPTFDEKKITFKRVLLTQCQDEFEKHRNEELNLESFEGTEEEKFEQELRVRKRMVGNIKFIGELFKKDMLSEKIMHHVIFKLLLEKPVPFAEQLEVLCKLLATIGKILDTSKNAQIMTTYFAKLADLTKNMELASRIRFMIQDTIELRANRWKPRRAEVQAKTINEVRKEAEEEEIRKSKELNKRANTKSDRFYEDAKPQYKPKVQPYNKEGSSKQEEASNKWKEVSKGVAGGSNRPGSASQQNRGPFMQKKPGQQQQQGGYQVKQQPQSSFAKGHSNMFSALQESGNNKSQKGSSNTNQKKFDSKTNGNKKDINKEEIRPKNEQKEKQPLEVEDAPEQVQFTEDELKKKTKFILDEYLSSNEVSEAGLCVRELQSPAWHKEIISEALLIGGEKDEKSRVLIAALFKYLKEQDIVTVGQIVEGYETAICQVNEYGLVMDIPYIFKNLGHILGLNIAGGVLSFADIDEILEEELVHQRLDQEVADVLLFLFKTLVAQKGEETKSMLQQGSFDLFLHANPGHASVFGPLMQTLTSDVPILLEADIATHVFDAVCKEQDADQLLDWLKALPSNPKNGGRIINAVLSAVMHTTTLASTPAPEKEQTALLRYLPIFQFALTISSPEDALVGLQYLSYKCKSQGLFNRIVQFLFDNALVNATTLTNWKNLEDTTPGKADATREIEDLLSKC